MVDILHRVGITASQDAVYEALTTTEGLTGWWTSDVRGDGDAGGVVQFRFRFDDSPDPDGFDMSVLEAKPAERVLWEVVDGPGEWIGTQVSWDLRTEGDYTIIMFAHSGLAGARGVHAPLQHQVGDVPGEPEGVRRDGHRGAGAERGEGRRLALRDAQVAGSANQIVR